jgi:menaquinone-dependent protoporphyrinogen oxidase
MFDLHAGGAIMHAHILVTYATRNGSTEEVAAFIASALRDHGFLVELRLARDVHTLEPYSAVVVGAAIYMSRLHKDVRHFLSANRDALTKLPVALFVLGPVQNLEKDWTGARQQLDKQLAKFPWFSPVEQRLFGGRFDAAKLGFPFNRILKNIPVGDIRDWVAIGAFANELAARFQPDLQPSIR